MPTHPKATQAAHRRRFARPQQGFTLVELIAVVIILGLLAAVLVPRYMGLGESAAASANKGAVSEGMGRFNLAYQQYLTNTGNRPTSLSDLSGAQYLNLDGSSRANVGDFDIAYSLTGTTLTVEAYKKGGATALANATATWP